MTFSVDQQLQQTNRYFLNLFWLTTWTGSFPFVVAAYLEWIPVPFMPILLWFLVYVALALPFSVMVLTGWETARRQVGRRRRARACVGRLAGAGPHRPAFVGNLADRPDLQHHLSG